MRPRGERRAADERARVAGEDHGADCAHNARAAGALAPPATKSCASWLTPTLASRGHRALQERAEIAVVTRIDADVHEALQVSRGTALRPCTALRPSGHSPRVPRVTGARATSALDSSSPQPFCAAVMEIRNRAFSFSQIKCGFRWIQIFTFNIIMTTAGSRVWCSCVLGDFLHMNRPDRAPGSHSQSGRGAAAPAVLRGGAHRRRSAQR